MSLFLNFWKSTVLATFIFWLIIFTERFEVEMLAIVFISAIPIFICCVVTIAITICPFFWLYETEVFDKKSVFRTFFPFYSIIFLGLCIYGILVSNFEIYMIAFFTASFITTSQSWIWFTKDIVP